MNIGILGLGVMGRSLTQNFERSGYSVAGYDVSLRFDKTLYSDKNIKIFDTLEDLVGSLDKPCRILMMVPAGKPVDKAIVSLKPYLETGDILIDGGNSFFAIRNGVSKTWRKTGSVLSGWESRTGRAALCGDPA